MPVGVVIRDAGPLTAQVRKRLFAEEPHRARFLVVIINVPEGLAMPLRWNKFR